MSSMLKFRNSPDYEMPRGMAMSDTNTNTYMVTVKATDGTYTAMKDVMVMVTNVVELGMLTADMDSSSSYMENGTMPVATYKAAGSMAGNARWTLHGRRRQILHARAYYGHEQYAQVQELARLRDAAGHGNERRQHQQPTWSPSRPRPAGKWPWMEVTIMVTNSGRNRYADRRSGHRLHRTSREQHGHRGNLHGLRLDGGHDAIVDDLMGADAARLHDHGRYAQVQQRPRLRKPDGRCRRRLQHLHGHRQGRGRRGNGHAWKSPSWSPTRSKSVR